MTTRFNETILLVRSICHSIRTQVKADVTKTSLFNIMKRIIRQNEITDLKLCRAPDELKFIGECYGTYLESGSKHHHLIMKHYLKPEFNVKRTADFLGFKLP
ncbi:C-mannosyltransferase dpy-19 [Sarcoptes scabiei]|nr:C-mannosyltransferase dpy-19 [Sarcoptes scabiei]